MKKEMDMKPHRPLLALGLWAAFAIAGAQSLPPQTYGTTAVSYVEIPAVAFDSSLPVTFPYTQTGIYARYTAGCFGCLVAPLRLPSGAKIVSLELDGVDVDAFDSVAGTLWVCDRWGSNCSKHPAAAAGPADCAVPGFVCTGKAFADGPTLQIADLTPDGIVVDNTQNSYLLTGVADASTVTLGGMIVGYVLQVSPAPTTPTFGDVPTSDPAFQYVEALVASGVTVGCGGGNYCPDSPLTRRQMAVFLAKALGLQWP
jgi:hypothetical protein